MKILLSCFISFIARSSSMRFPFILPKKLLSIKMNQDFDLFSNKKIIDHVHLNNERISIYNTNDFSLTQNGFIAMVGPEKCPKKANSLFELFTSNGIIKGIFYSNGVIHSIHYSIETEKFNFEQKYGRIPSYLTPLAGFLDSISLFSFPNLFGVANTAILKVDNKFYSLFERDLPYPININWKNKTITTNPKLFISKLKHFSGHSKYQNSQIYTIEYSVFMKKIRTLILNNNFNILFDKIVNTKYHPIPHDFVVIDDVIKNGKSFKTGGMIVIDSPIILSFNKIPLSLNSELPTYIHFISSDMTKKIETFSYPSGFVALHYSHYVINKDILYIYVPLYEKFNLENIDIFGKYRCIALNLMTREISIGTNPELEKYNLDFPVRYGNWSILRNIDINQNVNGFVVCDDLNIIQTLFFEHLSICGEGIIINDDFVFFAHNKKENISYIMSWNMKTWKISSKRLPEPIQGIGYHSIFISF